jgi:hypothetical protein
MSRILLFSAMVLLLPAACDPQEAHVTKEGAAVKGHHDSAKADAAADELGTVTFTSLSECLQSCEHEKAIATNRETCRLNCDSAYGAPAGSVIPTASGAPGNGMPAPSAAAVVNPDPVGQAAECMGRCYSSSGGVTTPCVDTCKSMVSVSVNAPSANTLDHLSGCLSVCHSDKKLTPTNRATCELNCTQAARVTGPHAAL